MGHQIAAAVAWTLLCCLWIKEAVPRIPSQLAELRSDAEPAAKGAILLIWGITAFLIRSLLAQAAMALSWIG